jgi:hypothetical protein
VVIARTRSCRATGQADTPSGLVATAVSQTGIGLTWHITGQSATGFRIERSLSSAEQWSTIATVGQGVTTYADNDLSYGTTYDYRVVDTTDANPRYSNVATAATNRCAEAAIYVDIKNALDVTDNTGGDARDVTDAVSTSDTPSLPCASGAAYYSVWYRYDALSDGILSAQTFGSNYDTLIAVWSGNWSALENVACNDNTGQSLLSSLQAPVSAQTSYYIQVASYQSAAAAADLHFRVTMTPTSGHTGGVRLFLPLVVK